jgi:hypothetical protein
LLDGATGKQRGRIAGGPKELRWFQPTPLAFSADGQWLAVGGTDGYLRLWEVSTCRELHRLHGHEEDAQALAFSADGRRLISFGGREALVWNLRPTGDPKPSDAFADLVSDDGRKVYGAMWALAADPSAPVLLRQKIPAVRLDVRPERIDKLIADLDSPQFSVRDAAQRQLAELQRAVRPALLAALEKKPSLETARRISKLLDALDGAPGAAALRELRAVHALELQGSEAACQVLQEWAAGTPGLRLTDAAGAALARLRSGLQHKEK